jgi:hypothetical protein
MAQYIGYLQGQRREVSRLGTKKSGLVATAQGWEVGARIYISWNEKTQEDEVWIYATSGTNGRRNAKLLGKITAKDLE